mmetsp:Transcript_5100/g.12846  ORF Transcript_5100/g.12846 Transcript_5100/m.12846 type:complete len:278 (-) Transcript_5100:113-946(-)
MRAKHPLQHRLAPRGLAGSAALEAHRGYHALDERQPAALRLAGQRVRGGRWVVRSFRRTQRWLWRGLRHRLQQLGVVRVEASVRGGARDPQRALRRAGVVGTGRLCLGHRLLWHGWHLPLRRGLEVHRRVGVRHLERVWLRQRLLQHLLHRGAAVLAAVALLVLLLLLLIFHCSLGPLRVAVCLHLALCTRREGRRLVLRRGQLSRPQDLAKLLRRWRPRAAHASVPAALWVGHPATGVVLARADVPVPACCLHVALLPGVTHLLLRVVRCLLVLHA